MRIFNLTFGLLIIFFYSCVPARKYSEISTKAKKLGVENNTLKGALKDAGEIKNELEERNKQLKGSVDNFKQENTRMKNSMKLLTNSYDKIQETYQLLLDKNRELLLGRAQTTNKLMTDLQKSGEELQAKEDALNLQNQALLKKEETLKRTTLKLREREIKVSELEKAIARKDSSLNAIKAKVKEALIGVEKTGIKVEQKARGIYVSLDEKLLFSSGNYNVQKGGEVVLKKLAKGFSSLKNVNITVEGHTDSKVLRGKGPIADNWDLSVKRATSVVKILVKNGMDASIVAASGRGEFLPISSNETSQGRSKNRRIEIILSPNYLELYEIID